VERGAWSFGQIGPWSKISAEAKDLVTKLMEMDVDRRLSAIDALEHPWIKQQASASFNKTIALDAV